MRKLILNEISIITDDRIDAYTVHQKPSSNIDYFGLDLAGRKMFIQFKNGITYIYNDVDDNTMENSLKADSIGKYLNANVIGKFTSTKIESRVVEIDTIEQLIKQSEDRMSQLSQTSPIINIDINPEPEF